MEMENKGWTTEYNLTDDVLMEVLSRVPAKSLARFKFVSKHWCSLILNPNFISLHHSRAQPYFAVSLRRDQNFLSQNWHQKWSMCLLPDQNSIHHPDLPFVEVHRLANFVYAGSCNGLVCFYRKSTVVICNPTTEEKRLLPQPPYHNRGWSTCCIAFGFDSRTNDYIVARVAALDQPGPVDHKIHVYGMAADSWEEIAATTVPNQKFSPNFQPCISLDGVFYWLTYDSTTYVHVIHALNIVERLFEQISLPAGLSSEYQRLELCLLNDSVALLQRDDKPEEQWFDVWLMDKHGVEDFWTKRYSIGPLLGYGHPSWFQANSEVLLIRRNYEQIFLYDQRTRAIKEYNQIRNVPGPFMIEDVFPYVESLVPVKRQVATSLNSNPRRRGWS